MSPRLTQHRTTEVRRVVATSTEDLRGTVGLLHEAFGRRCEQDGTKSTMRGNWARLFEEMDEDESGRLDSREFVAALVDLEVADEISDDSAEALWRYVDADGSGEVTIKEFQSAVYLLMVEGWPSHDEATLRRSVAALNHAVETRHERKKCYDTEGRRASRPKRRRRAAIGSRCLRCSTRTGRAASASRSWKTTSGSRTRASRRRSRWCPWRAYGGCGRRSTRTRRAT